MKATVYFIFIIVIQRNVAVIVIAKSLKRSSFCGSILFAGTSVGNPLGQSAMKPMIVNSKDGMKQ